MSSAPHVEKNIYRRKINTLRYRQTKKKKLFHCLATLDIRCLRMKDTPNPFNGWNPMTTLRTLYISHKFYIEDYSRRYTAFQKYDLLAIAKYAPELRLLIVDTLSDLHNIRDLLVQQPIFGGKLVIHLSHGGDHIFRSKP